MRHPVPGKVEAILSRYDSHAIWKEQDEAEAELLPVVWRHSTGKATVRADVEKKIDKIQDEWDVRLGPGEQL